MPSSPAARARAMTSSSSRMPWSSVRLNASSSLRSHISIVSRPSCSSGYAEPIVSRTTPANRGRKPVSIPIWRPCTIARRIRRRST